MKIVEERIRRFEQRLLEERERAVRSLRRARRDDEGGAVGSRDAVPYSQHMAEAGAELQEQETAHLVASREGERLVQIDAALHLIREAPGKYFTCEACGAPIEEARLDFLPWTRLCAADARRADS
ncbi:MAG: TraR/DksA family transcriptional regulator [Longimicrobiales bacterium]